MTTFLRFEDRGGLIAILNTGTVEESAFDEPSLRLRATNRKQNGDDAAIELAALAELMRRKRAQPPAGESEVTDA